MASVLRSVFCRVSHRWVAAQLLGLTLVGLAACGGGGKSGVSSDSSPPELTHLTASPVNTVGQVVLSATASDNIAVTAYCFKHDSVAPEASNACFTPVPRSDFIAVTKTAQTWYAWARDAAGLVSAPQSVVVAGDAVSPGTPVVKVRVQASNRTAVISASTSDDSGVAAYCFKTDAAQPAAGDSCFDASPRRVVDLTAAAQLFHVWAKDNVGNISASSAAYAGCSASAYDAASRSALPVVCFSTSLGEFVLELEDQKAPITVSNFLRYVSEDFYVDTVFHRIMSSFMVQGGGFSSSMVQKAASYPPIPLESTQVTGLSHWRGTIGMARSSVDSATTEFFVNVVNNTGATPTETNLNYQSSASPGYAVFGRVIHGLDSTIEGIRQQPVSNSAKGELSVPASPPVIYWAYRIQ